MIAIIAAVSRNGVIGKNGEIPWHLSTDMKRFANLTTDRAVIMGRKTYESILAHLKRPLPNRESIVVTRQENFSAPGCRVVNSLDQAIKLVPENRDAFIVGGAEIYKEGLRYADMMYLTEVDCVCEGDAFFPKWDKAGWKILQTEKIRKDAKNDRDSVFVTYAKHSPPPPSH